MKSRIVLLCGAAVLVAFPARALDPATVTLGDDIYALGVTSCRVGDTYYLIDAAAGDATLSLVGALEGDETYTTIDFFFTAAGESKRAGTRTDAIPLQNGAFSFEGEVEVSDSSTQVMRVMMPGC